MTPLARHPIAGNRSRDAGGDMVVAMENVGAQAVFSML